MQGFALHVMTLVAGSFVMVLNNLKVTVNIAAVCAGVHHLYFYLPNTQGASRVLAKMLRRWMPPSSTWLFPPRYATAVVETLTDRTGQGTAKRDTLLPHMAAAQARCNHNALQGVWQCGAHTVTHPAQCGC